MNATLIPYFLVCNINIKEGDWKYGPEYIFQVEANITAIPTNFNSTAVHSMFNPKLFCRPKQSDTLNCYFQETNMTDWDHKSSSTKDIEMSNEPFDIKFNERGIEHLIVPADTENYKISIIRSIVKQLDIGDDLRDKSYGTYDVVTSDVEECRFSLQLCQHDYRIPEDAESCDGLEIQLHPALKAFLTDNITVTKDRSLRDCNLEQPFFFGSVRRLQNASKYLEEKLQNSQSIIEVTNNRFVSFTKSEGTLGAPIRFKKMQLVEFICLTLVDVRPATSEILEIVNPGKVKVIPNSQMERISA